MNYRRLSQGAEWGVLVAVLALHAVILAPFSSHAEVAWLQIAADAQPLAVVVMVLAWGAFGPGRWWLRLAAVPLMLLGWVAYFSLSEQRYGYLSAGGGLVSFPVSLALAAAAIVVLVRLGGLRGLAVAPGRPEPRPQFSIRGLLATTTLVAIVIGCLEMLRPAMLVVPAETSYDQMVVWLLENQAADRMQSTVRQWVLSIAVAAGAVAALATVLRPGPVFLRLAVLVAAIPALASYLTHIAGTSAEEFSRQAFELTAALAAPAALVAISLLPLRLMGYRLMRPLCCPATKCVSMVPSERERPHDVDEPIMSDGDQRTTLLEAIQ